jgi:hypothetical protein
LVDQVSDSLLHVYILGQAAGVLVCAGEVGWREVADQVRDRIGDAPGDAVRSTPVTTSPALRATRVI